MKETKYLYTLQNDPLLTYYANAGHNPPKLGNWCGGAAAVAALGGGVGLAGDTNLLIAYVVTFTLVVYVYVHKLQQEWVRGEYAARIAQKEYLVNLERWIHEVEQRGVELPDRPAQ
ncbi:MAG: hypothetical protein FJY54_01950 [Betaproteobacteria bacterium]|nr:hypothetical protein [Betaproteobacteria bacterium]